MTSSSLATQLMPTVSIGIAVLCALSGCATIEPKAVEEVGFTSRAETQTKDNLMVSVAIPTRKETKTIYGADLAAKGMQVVWVEVKNDRDIPAWLLASGLDPEYFSPSEAAYAFNKTTGNPLEAHFKDLQFNNPILPESTSAGFFIVRLDEGFKAVNIDLISREKSNSFTYIILDPSFKGDFTLIDFETIYHRSELIDLENEDALRRAIEMLPVSTTNKKGDKEGDPLNLVLIGNTKHIIPAFVRRNWHATEIMWSKAILRTAKSFVQGSRYRYSPISPLYVYGRRQDLSFQKSRGTIHERNHLRLWLTPLRYQEKDIWVGQISRDIGVKFTTKSPTISTHVIDPDVDETRTYLIEDLAYSQALKAFGFLNGVGVQTRDAPRYNLVGDPYFTDGLTAVMFFDERPFTFAELEIMAHWENPSEVRAKIGEDNL